MDTVIVLKKDSVLIVFDLFGTIIQTPNPLEVKQLLEEIDQHCGGPGELYQKWLETSDLRDKGHFDDPHSYWDYLGVNDLSKATMLYSRTNDYWLTKIRPGALECLTNLNIKYENITLCSNAGFETHNLLKKSELYKQFKKTVISADVKSLKPEDSMYEYSIPDNLFPDHKFFIGDGGSLELDGAYNNNFKPIQISELKHDGSSVYRMLNNEFTKIDSLDQIELIIEMEISKNEHR